MPATRRTSRPATVLAFAAITATFALAGCSENSESPKADRDGFMDTTTTLASPTSTTEATADSTPSWTPTQTTHAAQTTTQPTTTTNAPTTTQPADRAPVDLGAVDRGKARLNLGGRDLGISTDTFGPCIRTSANAANITARFDDGTVLAFDIVGGELSVLEITNPGTGVDLDYTGSGSSLTIADDIVSIDGALTSSGRSTAFAVVANCPL